MYQSENKIRKIFQEMTEEMAKGDAERYPASHFFPHDRKPPADALLPIGYVAAEEVGVVKIVRKKADDDENDEEYVPVHISYTPFFVASLHDSRLKIYVYDNSRWLRQFMKIDKIYQISSYLKLYIFPIVPREIIQYTIKMAATAPRANSLTSDKIEQVWKLLASVCDFTSLPTYIPVPSIRAACEEVGVPYDHFRTEMAKNGVIETESVVDRDPVTKKPTRYIMLLSPPIAAQAAQAE